MNELEIKKTSTYASVPSSLSLPLPLLSLEIKGGAFFYFKCILVLFILAVDIFAF